MKKAWLVAAIPGMLALVAGVFLLVLLVVKWLWAWTVPDLFPGAVQQGLVAKEISWFTSLKLTIFIAVLTGISRGTVRERHD